MNITEARKAAHAASRALNATLANGTADEQTVALANLNKAYSEAVAAGAREFRGTIRIVDGKPLGESTVTPERAAEVMANAARANARK